MATVPARAPLPQPRHSAFYLAVGLFAALIVVLGFSRTYYLKSFFGTPALTPLVHLHGIVFTSWIALFITQTWLISANKRKTHMRLGIAGLALAIAMIFVGSATAIASARLGHPIGGRPLVFLALPLSNVLLSFPVLIAAGFYFRRRADFHKRLMLCATLALLTAAFGRIVVLLSGGRVPLIAMACTDLLLIAVTAYDAIRNRRIHPAFVGGTTFVIFVHVFQFAIARTAPWLAFARWLTS